MVEPEESANAMPVWGADVTRFQVLLAVFSAAAPTKLSPVVIALVPAIWTFQTVGAACAGVLVKARTASKLAMRAGEPTVARRWRQFLIGLIRFSVFIGIFGWCWLVGGWVVDY